MLVILMGKLLRLMEEENRDEVRQCVELMGLLVGIRIRNSRYI